MKFGVLMFPADYAIDPVTLGRAAEDRGFESLFFPEHTHIPTSRESPWPGGPELPLEYSHTYDPFVAFGAIAATSVRSIREPVGLLGEHRIVSFTSGDRASEINDSTSNERSSRIGT